MSRKRQIILIITDTQRKDMVGCYGNPDLHTPNLDRMAGKGVRFENAYCCQPVCGPARSAMFTGTFPHSNGSWANTIPISLTTKTVGQRLSDEGIYTAYIGKWHLDGGDYFGSGKCPDGWDPNYWYDMRNYLEELTPEERLESRRIRRNRSNDISADFTFGHQCSNRAIEFIQQHYNEDFLLVVSYDEPHGPFLCPNEYYKKFENYEFPKSPNVEDTLENKPEHQKVWAEWNLKMNRKELKIKFPEFLGCNSFVDYEIGRVLDAIDQYSSEALVIYTSDHGEMLQSHCLTNKGPVMYDEITNIPFIVKWKGKVQENSSSDQLMSHIDITPTILDYFNLNISKVIEGKSMIPFLLSKNLLESKLTSEVNEDCLNSEIYMEFGRYEVDHDSFGGFQLIRCVRNYRYKLVVNLLTSDELYDLQEDPYEMHNLIDSKQPTHQKIRNQLHDNLLDWMNETRDPFRGYYWEIRPWREDARTPSWRNRGYTRQREEDERYESRQLDYSTGLPMENATRKK
ncbi:MAG: sulfatase-like hydrolase/transferase [Promethearchaeota archaeon]